ncbi:MAG: hypothetical protein ACFBWO_01985, partial [Paracoccaceae bacterium]
ETAAASGPAEAATPRESASARRDAESAGTPAPAATAPTRAARMTRGEREALSLSLREHFTYVGRQEPDLSVTVAITLDEAGRIVYGPLRVSATGGSPATQDLLFRTAKTTLAKAQRAGVFATLPAEKFDAWQSMEITFTPDREGVRLPS